MEITLCAGRTGARPSCGFRVRNLTPLRSTSFDRQARRARLRPLAKPLHAPGTESYLPVFCCCPTCTVYVGIWRLRTDWRKVSSQQQPTFRGWIKAVNSPANQTASGSPLSVFLHIPKAAGEILTFLRVRSGRSPATQLALTAAFAAQARRLRKPCDRYTLLARREATADLGRSDPRYKLSYRNGNSQARVTDVTCGVAEVTWT